MTIEQNLAIAYYKNKPRGLQLALRKRPGIFREKLSMLVWNGKSHDRKSKVAIRGQRQSLTLFMAVIAQPKTAALLDEHTAA